MNRYQKILLPTDFSESAENSYDVAKQIANKFSAKIDVMHVVPSAEYLKESLKKVPVALDPEKQVIPTIITDNEERLKKLLKEFPEAIRGKIHIGMNRKPADSIIHHAREGAYDLIVMGAKGEHRTLARRGVNTERVLRNSTIPVLAVDDNTEPHEIKRIVVPTDSSQLSFTALPHAASIAHAFGAEISLLYVLELFGGLTEDSMFIPEQHEKVKIYEQLMKRLEHFLADHKPEGVRLQRSEKAFLDGLKIGEGENERFVPLKTEIRTGYSVHYEIEQYSENNADLLVMATHGYSGFAHLFLGSVTEKVIQNLPRPVMTIRPTEQQFKKAERSTIGMVTYNPIP